MGKEDPISIDLRDYCDAAEANGNGMNSSFFAHEVPSQPTILRIDCPFGKVSPLLSVRPRIVIYQSGGELQGEVGCSGCDLKKGGFSKCITP